MNELLMNVLVAAMGVIACSATAWAVWLEHSEKN